MQISFKSVWIFCDDSVEKHAWQAQLGNCQNRNSLVSLFTSPPLWQPNTNAQNKLQHQRPCIHHLNGLLRPWPWPPESNRVISRGYWIFPGKFHRDFSSHSWDIVVTRSVQTKQRTKVWMIARKHSAFIDMPGGVKVIKMKKTKPQKCCMYGSRRF